MDRKTISYVLVALLVLVPACTKHGGIGRPGSPMWKRTASQEQQNQYWRERNRFYREQCRAMGAEGDDLYECSSRLYNNEHAKSARREAQFKRDLDETAKSLNQPSKKLDITNCHKGPMGNMTCYHF